MSLSGRVYVEAVMFPSGRGFVVGCLGLSARGLLLGSFVPFS
jgi:hypothetical protein